MADDLDALATAGREAHLSRIREVGGSALEHEAYRRIASAVAARAVHDAGLDVAAFRKRIMQLEAELRQVLDRDKISDEEGTGNG